MEHNDKEIGKIKSEKSKIENIFIQLRKELSLQFPPHH